MITYGRWVAGLDAAPNLQPLQMVCADRRHASARCWVKVAGTSSSSAEVLCPVRPTGLMGGVTSWPGLVHLRRARMHWRWTCHCQHHAVPRCWQCQIAGTDCARAIDPIDSKPGRVDVPHVGASTRPIGAFAHSNSDLVTGIPAISGSYHPLPVLGRAIQAAGPGGIARSVLINAQNTHDHLVRIR